MVGFIGYNVVFGIGPEVDHDYVLASGTGGPLSHLLREHGHHAVSADEAPADEAPGVDDGPLSSAGVLSVGHVQRELRRLGCRALVPFKSNARLVRVADELGIDILAAPAQLVRQLENKLSLTDIAAAAGVRIPETRTVRVDDTLAAELAGAGGRAIFQPAVSFAGAGTQLLDGAASIAELHAQRDGAVGKLVQFVEGEPITVLGAVVDGDDGVEVLVDEPAHQLTGIAECTPHPFGACGNDWTRAFGQAEAQAVRDVAFRVGAALGARAFRGCFGIDLVRDAAGVLFLIEVNPRWTAGLSLALQLQQLAAPGEPTLFDAHLVAWNHAPRALLAPLRARFGRERGHDAARRTDASSIIVFNGEDGAVDVAAVEPGRYALDGGALAFRGSAWRLEQLLEGEALVLPQSPSRPIAPGTELVRMLVRQRAAAGADCRALTPEAGRLVALVRDRALAAVA